MDSPRDLAAKLREDIEAAKEWRLDKPVWLPIVRAEAIAAELERGADAIDALEEVAYGWYTGQWDCVERALFGATSQEALAAAAVEGSNQ